MRVGGIHLEGKVETFDHDIAGDAVGFVFDGGDAERGGALALKFVACGEAVGREVRHLRVVAGDTHAGGGEGVERGEAFNEVVREAVDRR